MSPGWAKGLQLDRIKGNEGYSPENCQWLTQAENARKVRPKIRNADYESLIAENERLRQHIAELETSLTALVRLRTARAAPWRRERRAPGGGSPAPPLLDPRRDCLRVGPGLATQRRDLAGTRLARLALGRALEDPGHLSQQVGPAARELRSSATAAASSSPVRSRHPKWCFAAG
jgi:hypothetical protein